MIKRTLNTTRSGQSGSGLRGPDAAEKPYRKWLLPCAGCLLTLAVVVTIYAFRLPATEVEEVTDLEVRVDTEFTQLVTPVPSALYPTPQPLENQPFFYMRLMDRLTSGVATVIEVEPAARVSGTAEIIVRVVAPERWERTFVVREPRSFQTAEPVASYPVFNEEIPIPIADYQSFIALVEEETRVMPRGDYEVILTAVVELTAETGSATVSERFEFPYTFQLAGQTLIMEPSYEQRQSASATHTITRPGMLPVGAASLPVSVARIVGGIVSALACILVIWAWRERRRRLPPLSEAQRILRRYKSRLISAKEDAWVDVGRSVELASFQDLLRVADLLEQVVLVVPSVNGYRFIVMDTGVAYSYSPQDGAPAIGAITGTGVSVSPE